MFDNDRKRKNNSWDTTSRDANKRTYRSNDRYDNNSWGKPRQEPVAPPSNPPIESFVKNFLDPFPSSFMSESESISFRKNAAMCIKGHNIPPPIRKFTDLLTYKLKSDSGHELFADDVVHQFQKEKYTSPTPIQAQGWTMALAGRDMVGIAQTGSGKTLSFVLPALIHAASQPPLRRNDGPIVLILAPTRELVLQIHEVVAAYTRFYKLSSAVVYGGVSSYPQKQSLRSGVEVLVATPGRLIDLYDQGCFSLERVTFMILDEADRMLDMGFEPQLKKIIPKTNKERQTLMWSATWPKEVRNLAETYMKDYVQVNIGNTELRANKKISQVVKVVENREKRGILIQTLNGEGNSRNQSKFIVFCNTKRMCDDLEYYLSDKNYKAVSIHGDKSQNVRDRVINDFKNGRKNILIATDVAARGLDVKDVYMVINYDFPKQCEDYVHRIGRTARGDSLGGKALSFFTNDDRNCAKELIKILEESNSEIDERLREIIPRSSGYGNNKSFRRW